MLSNLKVAHKLVVAFAVLVAAVAGAGALAWSGLSSIQRVTALNAESYAYRATVEKAAAELVEQQNAARGFVASLDPRSSRSTRTSRASTTKPTRS
jgi:methyl-accepting chemotaxis protein